MENAIKQMAQLLFDNAEYLTGELNKTGKHRHFSVNFDAHKTGDGVIDVSLWIVGADAPCIHLVKNQVEIERIQSTYKQLNIDAGVEPSPEPVELRESL